jgi:hypothetical protein
VIPGGDHAIANITKGFIVGKITGFMEFKRQDELSAACYAPEKLQGIRHAP